MCLIISRSIPSQQLLLLPQNVVNTKTADHVSKTKSENELDA
jgi:hypothetical protein